jgi:hypothetical protein
MLNKKVEKIAILKAALAKISQEKQEIKLTREDIEGNTDKFIDYIGLDMKSEKVKGDLADVIIEQHDDVVLESTNPY